MDGSISIKDGKSGQGINKLTSNSDIGLSLPIYYGEEDTLEKHPKSDKYPLKWVGEIDFSKDGNTLFTYSSLINVKWHSVRGTSGPSEVWDVKTGQQLASLKTHVSIQTSSNSKTIALIGHKSCEIWDIKTKRKITEFPNIKIIRFSGDGKTYAIIGKDFYALWDIASHSEIMLNRQIIEWEEDTPEDYFLSYDGTLLATIDENGTIALWETRNSKRKRSLITGYAKPFFSLAFAEDSNSLATLDLAKNIHVWDISNRKKTQTIKTGSLNLGKIAYSQNDNTLIYESEGIIKKWDISSGKLNDTFTIPEASSDLFSASFDDGTHLNIHGTSVFSKKNNTLFIETRNGIEVWDIHTQKCLNSFEKVKQTVDVSILSNNEHKLAVSSGYDVRLWDTHTQNEYVTLEIPMNLIEKMSQILRFKFYSIYSLALSPDGKILAVGTSEKRIHIWDITSRSIIKTLQDQKYVSSQLVFSPDCKLLASGDTKGLIHLWEVPSYKHVATYDGYKNSIRSLIFSPDGKSLASTNIGNYSGTILLWNIPSK